MAKEDTGPESGRIQVRLNEKDAKELWEAKNELEPHLRWADFYKKMIYKGIEEFRWEKSLVDYVKAEREKQDILETVYKNSSVLQSQFGAKYKRIDPGEGATDPEGGNEPASNPA